MSSRSQVCAAIFFLAKFLAISTSYAAITRVNDADLNQISTNLIGIAPNPSKAPSGVTKNNVAHALNTKTVSDLTDVTNIKSVAFQSQSVNNPHDGNRNLTKDPNSVKKLSSNGHESPILQTNQHVVTGRGGKGNRYLWPLGIAIAVTAVSALGMFFKIIFSVSMLSSIMSTASIVLSALFSLGNSHAHRRRYETASVAYAGYPAQDQFYADKRADEFKNSQTVDLIGRDFTTEYSNANY